MWNLLCDLNYHLGLAETQPKGISLFAPAYAFSCVCVCVCARVNEFLLLTTVSLAPSTTLRDVC